MTNGFKFDIHGLPELEAKLKKLGNEKLIKNAARRSLQRGAAKIRDAARRNARQLDDPKTANNIAKNITIQSGGMKRERRVKGAMMRVGVLGGAMSEKKRAAVASEKAKKGKRKKKSSNAPVKKNSGGDTWYWRLLEFGTSRMAAKPFMRKAMAQSSDAAVTAIAQSASVELDKEIAKLNVS